MAEHVRLVVWDLDETFWRGTVTEGGIKEYVQQNHDIVIELARRGIMSSICSKNDLATVLPILEEKGILQYFIFPSVSWEAKGPRLAQLVETVQLRAPTVMFIDDNPNNRAEAAATVAGLQVESETFIPFMLDDPRFKGKDDHDLARLAQYRLLESRKLDEKKATGGNEEFLRRCDIKVLIEYDIEPHIDRAIELINRTNQLNYTKRRLSEDIQSAREELRRELRPFDRQAGLVRVSDKYGDYGIVGFFLTAVGRKNIEVGSANVRLEHFCFSCRTLGMRIEQWVYELLGRPELSVMGEVLTDLSLPRSIDWVTQVHSMAEQAQALPKVAPELLVYGGCEAHILGVYLNGYTEKLVTYGNYAANGLFVRSNYTPSIIDACDRTPEDFSEEAQILGLPLHLEARDIFANAGPETLFVFNLSMDAGGFPVIRHKLHGWTFALEPALLHGRGFLSVTDEELQTHLDSTNFYSPQQRDHVLKVNSHLRKNYQLMPPPSAEERVQNIRNLIARIPKGSKLIIAVNHFEFKLSETEIIASEEVIKFASLMRQLASEYAYVGVASVSEVLRGHEDLTGADHYSRDVYLKFAQRIVEVAGKLASRRDIPVYRKSVHANIQIIFDIDFSAGGNSLNYIGSGWSGPETDYTWTEGDTSFVRLPVLIKAGEYALRIVAGALISKPFLSEQVIKIFLNNHPIWSGVKDDGDIKLLEARFSAENFIGKTLDLRIEHPAAARPSDLSALNNDGRRLALSFKRLTLIRFT